MNMKPRFPRYYACALTVLMLVLSCSEDSPVNPSHPEGELVIDSVSVYIVRGIDPYSGNPAGNFVFDLYYRLIGSTGTIYRVEFTPTPPGTNTIGIERPGYLRDGPLPINTPLEYHNHLWFEYDYADSDSIWIYFAATVRLWSEFESTIREETIRFPLGEDRQWLLMKIDVRDE